MPVHNSAVHGEVDAPISLGAAHEVGVSWKCLVPLEPMLWIRALESHSHVQTVDPEVDFAVKQKRGQPRFLNRKPNRGLSLASIGHKKQGVVFHVASRRQNRKREDENQQKCLTHRSDKLSAG